MQYQLSASDMDIINKNIEIANAILKKLPKQQSAIKENCESQAIKDYLNSL